LSPPSFACQKASFRVCKCRPLSHLPNTVVEGPTYLSRTLVNWWKYLASVAEGPKAFGPATTLFVCSIRFWFLLAFLALLLPAIQTRAAAPEPVRIVEAAGKVEVMRNNSGSWDKASAEAPYNLLNPGDQLRTGENSRAAIMLSDKSIIRLGEGAQIHVLSTPKKRAGFSFMKGLFYFFHRDNPDELDLETPTVSAVVRGTEFNLRVAERDGATVLSLLDGRVVIENAFGKVDLASGEEGVVELGKRPEARPMPVLQAKNIIQWCLYYPGVLDTDELELTAEERQALRTSINTYKTGDLVGALEKYPSGRQPGSPAEKVYLAAVLLSVGQVEKSVSVLTSLRPQAENSLSGAEARALLKVIAVVKGQPITQGINHGTATESLAESYALQSSSDLTGALGAAYRAVQVDPNFGFGWARVADLEFSFGRTDLATRALERALELMPHNAQALALKGFVLTAQNKIKEAVIYFDRAIATDAGLANAWLGRGLCRIRKGDVEDGVKDLEVAAALEPERSTLRAYLGKGYHQEWDNKRANRELELAKKLDPSDPTGWLYSALIKQQENRINQAVGDLEKSAELNKNRSVYRSGLLLDEDRAVRSANLATIYQDDNMFDVSVREAMRAVNYDYANYSAHLFLAGSYDALRDPHLINLRYETPWLDEYLVANLLSDARAGTLSPSISQQEYTRLFERDHFGFASTTDYASEGDWFENAVQYGIFGNSSYAAEVTYGSFNGFRPNNDLELFTATVRAKQQLTQKDTLYIQGIYSKSDSGDLAQYYNEANARTTGRVHETQEPMVLLGYHHEWTPGIHTLVLGGRLQDTLQVSDFAEPVNFLFQANPGDPTSLVSQNLVTPGVAPPITSMNYHNNFDMYTAELQQIFKVQANTLIGGVRYQNGTFDTTSTLGPTTATRLADPTTTTFILFQNTNSTSADFQSDLERFSVYGYDTWQIADPLLVTVGVSYDWINFPQNIRFPPVSSGQETRDQVSPKVGLIWTPFEGTAFRASYTRSLGGMSFDQSFRLEPTQVGGFNQAYRSLVPESVVGTLSAPSFDTYGVAWDQKFPTRTYFGVQAELLTSKGNQDVGAYNVSLVEVPVPGTDPNLGITEIVQQYTPTTTTESFDYKEKNLTITLNQLLADEWSIGARYRLSDANLQTALLDIPTSVAPLGQQNQSATLNQVDLFTLFNHSSGFFSQFDALWMGQSNRGYNPSLPGDDFWQFNVFVGYRFPRRFAQIRLGVVNLTDRDYKLNPLNLTAELPHERMFVANLKFSF